MKLGIFPIIIDQAPGPVIISGTYSKDMPKTSNDTTLSLGAKDITACVRWEHSSEKRYIKIPEAVASKLGLPPVNNINLFREADNSLRFGPFIGLMVSHGKIKRQLNRRFDPVYIRLSRYAAQLGGAFVIFTHQDINWQESRVSALYMFDRRETVDWTPVVCALPRIIYDRSFGMEGRHEGYAFREELTNNPKVKVFNSFVKLGKLETYQLLTAHEPTAKFVPAFHKFSLETLKEMLNAYGSVYIKPNQLAKGEGIIRMKQTSEGYALQQHTSEGDIVDTLSTLTDIQNYLTADPKRNDSYVIQQEINLAQCLGNSFDLRVMLQKNRQGRWEITGGLGRIAKEAAIVTGPRSGGKVLPLCTVLSWAFPKDEALWSKTEKDINYLCIEAAKVLEREYGLLGELGVDLAIDRSGKLWLLEINGKPLKVSMERLHDDLVAARIYRYPILYAAFVDTC